MSRFLCDMGCHAGLAQVGDKLGSVEALVGAQRQLPCRSWGVAVDHPEASTPFGMAIHCPAGDCEAICRERAWVRSPCTIRPVRFSMRAVVGNTIPRIVF